MNQVKALALVAALVGSSAAFSAVVPEGSYPQITTAAAAQTVSRDTVAAEAARWNEQGRPGEVRGEQRPDFVRTPGESAAARDEVNAERNAWLQSGLADLVRGPTPDFGDKTYQTRLDRYESIRGNGTAAE